MKPQFLQILLLAKTLGFLQLRKISLDGAKIQANASKHRALSWGHASELEQKLKEELARRKERLRAIGVAKAKLEARATERYAAEQAEYEAKKAKRQAKAKVEDQPPKRPEPKAPKPGVRDRDQINLTDEESRIIPASEKIFQQAYNLQAGVETESLLIVTEHVTQKANAR